MSEEPGVCPQCGAGLAQPYEAPPWCCDCEWNLGAFAPPPRRKATRLDKFSHKIAFNLNRALYDELAASPPPRPTRTRARVFLATASVLLLALTLASVIGGLWLVIGHHVFGFRILGFFLVLIGLEVRPRYPRWKIELGVTSRTEAPALFALIDAVADQIKAPRIITLAVDERWNASCGRRGLRREPALVIGLPLWAALSPAGRVALLGHELGHLVNHDPARGALTAPALTTFGRLSNLFNPRALIRTFSARLLALGWLASLVAWIVFTPIWFVSRWIQFGLWMIASRDHQRAELWADAVALKLAGTDGAIELFDALLFDERLWTAVRRSAERGEPPARWHENAAHSRAEAQPRLRMSIQAATRDEASLFASHPPSGMRRRLAGAWPDLPPSDLERTTDWDAIDASLSRHFERVRRALKASH